MVVPSAPAVCSLGCAQPARTRRPAKYTFALCFWAPSTKTLHRMGLDQNTSQHWVGGTRAGEKNISILLLPKNNICPAMIDAAGFSCSLWGCRQVGSCQLSPQAGLHPTNLSACWLRDSSQSLWALEPLFVGSGFFFLIFFLMEIFGWQDR